MEFLLALSLVMMGDDDYEMRELGHAIAEHLTVEWDYPGPVFKAMRMSPDAEVRQRCWQIMDRYRDVPLPSGLALYHFRTSKTDGLWHLANLHQSGPDAKVYVHLLMVHNGLSRTEVGKLIEDAQQRRAFFNMQQSYYHAVGRVETWLGLRSEHDPEQ